MEVAHGDRSPQQYYTNSFYFKEDVSHFSSQTSLESEWEFTKSPVSQVSSISSCLCRKSLLEVVCGLHLLLLHYDLQFLHHMLMYALVMITSPPQALLMMMTFRVMIKASIKGLGYPSHIQNVAAVLHHHHGGRSWWQIFSTKIMVGFLGADHDDDGYVECSPGDLYNLHGELWEHIWQPAFVGAEWWTASAAGAWPVLRWMKLKP